MYLVQGDVNQNRMLLVIGDVNMEAMVFMSTSASCIMSCTSLSSVSPIDQP